MAEIRLNVQNSLKAGSAFTCTVDPLNRFRDID